MPNLSGEVRAAGDVDLLPSHLLPYLVREGRAFERVVSCECTKQKKERVLLFVVVVVDPRYSFLPKGFSFSRLGLSCQRFRGYVVQCGN